MQNWESELKIMLQDLQRLMLVHFQEEALLNRQEKVREMMEMKIKMRNLKSYVQMTKLFKVLKRWLTKTNKKNTIDKKNTKNLQ